MGGNSRYALLVRVLSLMLTAVFLLRPVYATPTLTSVALVPNGNYFIDTFEEYNDNFKILAGFEADEKWSSGCHDTTYKREGLQGLKLQLADNATESSSLNLSKGVDLDNLDYINLWIYVQSISDLDYVEIFLMTNSSNYSSIKKTSDTLSSGWNYLHDSKTDYSGNVNWSRITGINLTAKSKNTVYVVFDDLRAVKSAGHTSMLWEERGVWSIINATDKNNNHTLAYMKQDDSYAYSCRNFGAKENVTLIYKIKQHSGSAGQWHAIDIFGDGSIYGGYHIQIYNSNLRLMAKGDGAPLNSTNDNHIIQTNWNYIKAVINGNNIEIFDGTDKHNYESRLTYSYPNNSFHEASSLCQEVRDTGHWIVDDVVIQEHLRNASSTEEDGEAYSNETLYGTFLVDTDLESVTIDWHNNSQILLTKTTLNPKSDLSNVDNSFPLSLKFIGGTIYAKITVCGSSGCNSSFTQDVTVVNMPPYLNSLPQIDKSDVYVTDRNITCNLGNVFDLENDEIKSLWQWYKNENLILYAATSELDLTKEKWRKGDNITCSQQAYDSFGNSGIWYNSSTKQIKNSPPKIMGTFLEPEVPELNEDFKVVIDIYDADGDNINYVNYTLFDPDGYKIIEEKNSTITFSNATYSIWESSPYLLDKKGQWRYVIEASDNESTEDMVGFIYPLEKQHPPEIISVSLVENDDFFIDDFENGKKDLWFNHNSSALRAEIKEINESTDQNNHLLLLHAYNDSTLREATYCLNKNFSNLSAIIKLRQMENAAYLWGSIGIRNQDGQAFANEVQLHIYDKDIRIHDRANPVNDSATDFIEHTDWGWLWFQAEGQEYRGLYSSDGNHWNYTHEITYSDTTAPLFIEGIVCLNLRDSKEENESWIFDDIFIQEIINENKTSSKANLTVVYLPFDKDEDLLKIVKIEWYKNGVLQENLTRETLYPEFDLSNVDNTLPSSHLSEGEEWQAKITICDTSMLCSSALTQKVKIAESKDNVSAEYKKEGNSEKVLQPSTTLTGHSILNLKNRLISQNNSLIAIPYLMIIIAIINFVLKEFKLSKKNRKKLKNKK